MVCHLLVYPLLLQSKYLICIPIYIRGGGGMHIQEPLVLPFLMGRWNFVFIPPSIVDEQVGCDQPPCTESSGVCDSLVPLVRFHSCGWDGNQTPLSTHRGSRMRDKLTSPLSSTVEGGIQINCPLRL